MIPPLLMPVDFWLLDGPSGATARDDEEEGEATIALERGETCDSGDSASDLASFTSPRIVLTVPVCTVWGWTYASMGQVPEASVYFRSEREGEATAQLFSQLVAPLSHPDRYAHLVIASSNGMDRRGAYSVQAAVAIFDAERRTDEVSPADAALAALRQTLPR